MSEPTSDPHRLGPAQARRLLGTLSLRPGERILCLGAEGGALPGVAAILVGPTGRIVEEDTDPAALVEGRTLPYPDGEFDAVILEITASQSKHADLLAEVARVTSPSGRVAVAIPRPAGGESAVIQQLAEAAGLRGVAVRSESGTEFVTAFPPRPASAADQAATTEIHVHKPAGQLAQQVRSARSRRRGRLLIAAASAVVLAAAAGMAWGLAGADPGDDPPGDMSDLLAGDAELDASQPGADEQPAADEPPAGGGLPTNDTHADSGAASGSGSGSSTNDGGEPVNHPPIIEDIGVDSFGLRGQISPTVSDPDGDDVSLAFLVDGAEPLVLESGTGAVFAYTYDEVGDERTVSVRVTATDEHGASAQEETTHRLVPNTIVDLKDMRFALIPLPLNDCFGDESAQRLTGSVQLSDPFPAPPPIDAELRPDQTDVVLFDRRGVGVKGPVTLEVSIELTFAGETTSYSRTFTDSESIVERFEAPVDNSGLGLPRECRALLSYQVEFRRS